MNSDNHQATGRAARLLATVALAATVIGLGAGGALAYPKYDDGSGVGCVSCHSQFKSVGSLHNSHLLNLGIKTGGAISTTRCNVCHSNGGGTTPVYTVGSNAGAGGGGYGCAGCHGQDYGEKAGNLDSGAVGPYNGQPKASGYGLRLVHASKGVTVCATCHPSNPHTVLDETSKPPYYLMRVSNLTNPCDSAQEDLPFDVDTIGLDNDGNGTADYPNDPACLPPTTTTSTTTTTTTTLPVACGANPKGTCTAAAKAKLSISEKSAGKEKIKFSLTGIAAAVAKTDWGNPYSSDTSYALCVYNAAGNLAGSYEVARGGDTCATDPCWVVSKTVGYAYADPALTSDGISKILLAGGDAGKGKLSLQGSNATSHLPTGVTAALNGSASATVQFVTSDGGCYGGPLGTVKTADGLTFNGSTP